VSALGRLLKGAGLLFAFAILAYAAYLGWRVYDARQWAPRRVSELAASLEPEAASISRERIEILLAVEDPSFWTNDSWDFSSPGQGGTTLTQSLGKIIFFERFRGEIDKPELMVLSKWVLASLVSKETILRASLAAARFGRDGKGPVIGFAEASRRWFGKEVSALDDREWLSLVAMLIAPRDLDPVKNPGANAERVRRIERLLSGACHPSGLMDQWLEGCAGG
jgi:membrane carboxypeptidase/penicillin-binding protein PbpC